MHESPTAAAPEAAAPVLPSLLYLLSSVHLVKAIHVAVSLGLPDRLQEGEQSLNELAQATATHPGALLRLLRALGSLDLVEEVQVNRFAPTALTSFLCTNQSGSIKDLVLWRYSDWGWSSLGALEYSIRTGLPSFAQVHGTDIWTWLTAHPEVENIFNQTMNNYAVFDTQIVEAYDFSTIKILADIGGGYGHLLSEVLQRYPAMHGLLFDLEPAIAKAREHLHKRCQALAGNFFEQIPSGADAYLFKFVLHNWDDGACLRILKKCRAAMNSGNRLLIVEHLSPQGKWSREIACTDLVMLSLLGGRVRTERDFRELFTVAGFALRQIIPISHTHTIIEGMAM